MGLGIVLILVVALFVIDTRKPVKDNLVWFPKKDETE